MAATVARAVAGVFTLGTSELANAATGGQLFGKKPSGVPNPNSAPPTTPNPDDASKQALLDEQKRAAATGPGDITNIGGASGILTDSNAKYVKGNLLGGA